jgi:hypothetical protein
MLSIEELEAQSAVELPSRELLALVTVFIGNNEVEVPIAVAANLCDISVNVLARQLELGRTSCTAVSEAG